MREETDINNRVEKYLSIQQLVNSLENVLGLNTTDNDTQYELCAALIIRFQKINILILKSQLQ